ncbi:hypothetical protein PAXINDRAFT_155651 [Paxillus involutus ATCC 200175]|uniref:Uncharacterized protein n=1 Tax=Paxillus involutus ATCC 200175 TaxID=664439 RepID=A0A0C9U795_PAXIN|nr:hypothetical protein PAXINDRAFT_155651 [Paxillus involutus ATCC 200175]
MFQEGQRLRAEWELDFDLKVKYAKLGISEGDNEEEESVEVKSEGVPKGTVQFYDEDREAESQDIKGPVSTVTPAMFVGKPPAGLSSRAIPIDISPLVHGVSGASFKGYDTLEEAEDVLESLIEAVMLTTIR